MGGDMTTLEVLKAARELISDPARWTRDVSARNADGDECDLSGAEAVCWCASGAIERVAGYPSAETWRDRANAIEELEIQLVADGYLEYGEVTEFNDYRGTVHEDVVELFDRTIARLEAQS